MPFPFYRRLSPADKAIYRSSDAIRELRVPDVAATQPLVALIRDGLETDDRRRLATGCTGLVTELTQQLKIPPARVRLLAVRPSSSTSELHGLYTREGGKPTTISVWMRTAVQERPVSFRTFLRTLLHELGHHLDYELFRLHDSFHTEGFFRRESSLMRQIAPAGRRAPTGRAARIGAAPPPAPPLAEVPEPPAPLPEPATNPSPGARKPTQPGLPF